MRLKNEEGRRKMEKGRMKTKEEGRRRKINIFFSLLFYYMYKRVFLRSLNNPVGG
jgi:hypothetical protein